MKCRVVSALLLLSLLASPAFAWDCNYWSQSTNPKAECYKPPSDPSSHNTNTNTLGQGQGQDQHQGQGQTQSQTAQGGSGGTGVGVGLAASRSTSSSDSLANSAATADNAGNSQTTEFNSPRSPVNTAVAGFQITNAPCRYAEGLGIQTNNVGGSVGFTFKDKDCERFQYAQYMYARGQTAAGDRLMCLIKRIKEALGDDCIALVNEVVVVRAEYPPGERERRIKAHGGNTDK